MLRLRCKRAGLAAVTLLALSGYAAAETECEQAGRAAEQNYGLPSGLLQAIGRVESGRRDDATGRIAAWPWSIDVDGVPYIYNDATQVQRATARLREAGHQNIDVGCFQISLLYHPAAFTDLAEAFDPAANAGYAARFLLSLKQRLGSWADAIAAYHSANAERGGPYRDRVMAAWSRAPVAAVTAELPFGIHLWVPGGHAANGNVVTLQSESSPNLPKVITPTR